MQENILFCYTIKLTLLTTRMLIVLKCPNEFPPGLGSRSWSEPGYKFLWLKKNILLVLYFLHFTLLVCGEKNILPNLTNSQEPEPVAFGSFEPEPLEKKPGAGAGAAWEKIRSRSSLKKVRSRSQSR